MSSSKLIKGTLQTIVLKLLEDNEKMYGYQITQKVKELTNDEIVLTEGALYPTLHKLEADGFLTAKSEAVDGRLRKYYSLSEAGQKESEAKMNEITLFIENLQQVLNLSLAKS